MPDISSHLILEHVKGLQGDDQVHVIRYGSAFNLAGLPVLDDLPSMPDLFGLHVKATVLTYDDGRRVAYVILFFEQH
jgi:hypothetical protein